MRKRSDFKQAFSTLQQEDGGEQFAPTHSLEEQTMEIGIESVLYMVELERLLGGLQKFRMSRKIQAKSWERTVRPVVNSTLAKWLSRIQLLLQIHRLQVTAVYCNRRVGVRTTPPMTCFRDARVCNIWIQMKLTITEYSLTTSAQFDNKLQEERTLYLVLRLLCETEHDNDNVTTKTQSTFYTAHMNIDT